MTRSERVAQNQPWTAAVSIVAQCRCCNSHYMQPVYGDAERVEPLLFMDDDKLFKRIGTQSGRFLRHITEPLPPLDRAQSIEAQQLRDKDWFEDHPERGLVVRP